MPDMAKIRREGMRWNLINTLNKFRPYTTPEQRIYEVMQAIYPDTTAMEVRRELDYLADRKLLTLDKQPSGTWYADLTTQLPTVSNGMITVPPGPGHGVDLAPDLDAKFQVSRRVSTLDD